MPFFKKDTSDKSEKQGFIDKQKAKQEKAAYKAMLEDLFNDIYEHRARIYAVNFVRGMMFSIGGIIGATVVLALIVWILTLLGHVPVVGDYSYRTCVKTLYRLCL